MKSDEVAQPSVELSEAESALAIRVASGLTDDEIARQLEITKHSVAQQIAGLLARIGAKDRLEILLYAYSDPTIHKRINARIKSSYETGTSEDSKTERKAG
jgi:DNA-binding CsgD family transcriptional regulator